MHQGHNKTYKVATRTEETRRTNKAQHSLRRKASNAVLLAQSRPLRVGRGEVSHGLEARKFVTTTAATLHQRPVL
jgi:hypothetical protein